MQLQIQSCPLAHLKVSRISFFPDAPRQAMVNELPYPTVPTLPSRISHHASQAFNPFRHHPLNHKKGQDHIPQLPSNGTMQPQVVHCLYIPLAHTTPAHQIVFHFLKLSTGRISLKRQLKEKMPLLLGVQASKFFSKGSFQLTQGLVLRLVFVFVVYLEFQVMGQNYFWFNHEFCCDFFFSTLFIVFVLFGCNWVVG